MSLGDDSRLPAGLDGKVNAVEWVKGWEAGAVHVCERLASGFPLLEVQREVQIILETHRGKSSGHRRPRRGKPNARVAITASQGSGWESLGG